MGSCLGKPEQTEKEKVGHQAAPCLSVRVYSPSLVAGGGQAEEALLTVCQASSTPGEVSALSDTLGKCWYSLKEHPK